jgi:hypothetical protein
MSAEIVQIRDYQSKRAIERAHKELEKHAIEIANMAFPCVLPSYMDGSGIDGLYVAPDKDPA